MSSYSYESSSFSSGGAADAAFKLADSNADGSIDLTEFKNFLNTNAAYSTGASFESSSSSAGAAAGGAGFGASYFVDGGVIGGASTYETVASGAGFSDAAFVAGGAVQDAGASAVHVQHYVADAHNIYHDPNPQIIRRPAAAGVQTYTQNIKVRFLQPPPVPPHGPLIIKEVRPPQPPLPPPLRIRQQAPPLPTPPPLVLREKPPQPPAVIAAQTVIRRLAALPVPPRSVIIERLPPLPPKPRDIIIERWVPYPAQAKRRVLLQRAAAAKPYPQPRNVIIQYEPVQARVVHHFQRFGVVQANPAAYVQQYGVHLLDSAGLLAQARAAGVVEDISVPAAGGFVGFSSASYGQDASFGFGSGYEGGVSYVSGDAGFAGAGAAGGFGSSSYEVVGGAGFGGASGFSSGSWGASSGWTGNTSELIFNAADTNADGGLDQAEFSKLLGASA